VRGRAAEKTVEAEEGIETALRARSGRLRPAPTCITAQSCSGFRAAQWHCFICLLGLVAGTSGSTGSRLWEVLSPSALQLVFLIASLFSKHLYCLVFSAQRWNPNLSLCGFSGF
jgi:hypothetical protein